MASGIYYPAVSGDDGFWRDSVLDLTYESVRLGAWYGVSSHGFFRFPSVTIPQGSTITSSYLVLYCGNSADDTPVNLNIYLNDVDTAVAPTTAAEAEALALTSAVAWSNVGACNSFSARYPPDITTLLQTIVNRSGWSSGNAMQVVFRDTGGGEWRVYRNYLGVDFSSGSYKAELHITWDPPQITGEVESGTGLSDSISGFVLSAEIDSGAGLSSSFDCLLLAGSVTSGVGLSSSFDGLHLACSLTENIGMESVIISDDSFRPGATSDCGMWYPSTGYFSNTYLRFGWIGDSISGYSTHGFARFVNVAIPRGSKILTATMSFVASSQQGLGVIAKTRISAHNASNPPAPISAAEAELLPQTSNVSWSIIGRWERGDKEETVSIVTPLQEIIDRHDWDSGDALTLIIEGMFNSGAPINAYRSAYGFVPADLPNLFVTFECSGERTENVSLSDTFILDTPYRDLDEGVGVSAPIVCIADRFASITESTSIADSMLLESPYRDIVAGLEISDSFSCIVNTSVSFSALDYKVRNDGSFHSTANYAMANSSFGSLAADFRYDGGIIFSDVDIPFGTIITSAIVKFVGHDPDLSTGVCNAKCFFNDADNPPAPTTTEEYNALDLTDGVVWDNVPPWTEGVTYDSPELVSILQGVLDRSGWEQNNNIQFVIKNNGSDALWSMRDYRTVAHSTGVFRAQLHVSYERLTAGFKGEISTESVLDRIAMVRPSVQDHMSIYERIKWAWLKTAIDSMEVSDALEAITGLKIKEWMTIIDSEKINWTGSEILSDSLFVFDIAKSLEAYYKLISEGMVISDAANVALQLMITDLFTCIETLGSKWTGIGSIESTTGTSDTISLVNSFSGLIADGFSAEDAVKITLGLALSDEFASADTLESTWTGIAEILSTVGSADVASVSRFFSDLIADGMDISSAIKLVLKLIISDKLKFNDSSQNLGKLHDLAEETMTMEDVILRAFPKALSDSMDFAGISLADLLSLLSVSDSFEITEEQSPGLLIKQIVSDSFESMDSIKLKSLLKELIQDGLRLEVSVLLGGELWECWVLNTSAFHVSVYSEYSYNSYAVFNNTAYGCKSDGIYELSGDDDNGTEFHSGIILPQTNFGSDNKKRFRRAWMGVSGNNLTLKVETETGNRVYAMVDAEIGITRDLKGRSWTFSLEDFDSLDSISLVPVILSKR